MTPNQTPLHTEQDANDIVTYFEQSDMAGTLGAEDPQQMYDAVNVVSMFAPEVALHMRDRFDTARWDLSVQVAVDSTIPVSSQERLHRERITASRLGMSLVDYQNLMSFPNSREAVEARTASWRL